MNVNIPNRIDEAEFCDNGDLLVWLSRSGDAKSLYIPLPKWLTKKIQAEIEQAYKHGIDQEKERIKQILMGLVK